MSYSRAQKGPQQVSSRLFIIITLLTTTQMARDWTLPNSLPSEKANQ